MAKKLSWDTLSVDQLLVNEIDDPFIDFPLLQLLRREIANKGELVITTNSVRGVKDTGEEKRTDLQCSLYEGWDRTSWPIPYMLIDSAKEVFDRRHTKKAADSHPHIKSIPAAQYVRVDVPDLGWLNDMLDRSVRECAAIVGNVVSPVPADAKDHHFVSAAVTVFNLENMKSPSRKEIGQLLDLMGIQQRYNHKATITGIITKVWDHFRDDNSVVGQVSHHTDKSDIEDFINDPDNDFMPHDYEDETTLHIIKTIEDNKSFLRRYADDLIRKACETELKNKRLKVLIVNTTNTQSKKIQNSRNLLKDFMFESWNLRRDNVLLPVKDMFNFGIPEKKLGELNMEIWIKDQIDPETEPFIMSLDED
jgi:hypothetical protein